MIQQNDFSLKQSTLELFKKQFRQLPNIITRSPGRINIIGEHTDYNEGFVLPAAINRYAYIAVGERDDNLIHLYAVEYTELLVFNLNDLGQKKSSWTDYIIGIVDQLKQTRCKLNGFNLLLDSDLPIGAGMSSSAAIECATIFALNDLFKAKISKLSMVKMAQKAEHTFTGVQCGIMDMFASVFGKQNQVIKLDCRSLDFAYMPLLMGSKQMLLLNTNVKHSLASSAYNERKQQCEQGVAWVKEKYPEVNSLRDITIEMLNLMVAPKDPIIYKRCQYVIEENNRLLTACEALKKGDLVTLGRLMFETHMQLSKLYEVSCKELDFLVKQVKKYPSVLGARMMGGGFGGCTINLVETTAIPALVQILKPAYREATGLDLSVYAVGVTNGTETLINNTC
ncbi:MAG: galactokinase [Sphingobacteriia bacterium]|nr:MAG: galactokinase [Sphingobacteriia bacterium]TAH06528.1 MAG: galactokinase [Sphingobacteriia bacterium]